MKQINSIFKSCLSVFFVGVLLTSCTQDNLDPDNAPGVGGIVDLTPPEADFSFSQSALNFLVFQFVNESDSSTGQLWEIPEGAVLVGDDATLMDRDIQVLFPEESTFSVTLVSMDDNPATSEITQEILVEEPLVPIIPDLILANGDYTNLSNPLSTSGNTCACTGWIHSNLGTQGETSTGRTIFPANEDLGIDAVVSDVFKIDNAETDIAYQEFEVTPNASYTLNYTWNITNPAVEGESATTVLEIRVLAGNGFEGGYTPDLTIDLLSANSTTDPAYPTTRGYNTTADVENGDNVLTLVTESYPGDDDYRTSSGSFNVGDNQYIAVFIRGIGGGVDAASGFALAGNEEVRINNLTINAIN